MTEGASFDRHRLRTRSGSYERLISSFYNAEKINTRWKLLEKRPDLRISVDTGPLRTIIDYVVFKCHPLSSVARNSAIKGSDIDAGLVVLRGETPIEPQIAFIEELRRQGFDVYHPTEAAAITKASEALSIYDREKWREGIRRKVTADYNQIHFIPESLIREERVAQIDFDIYHAGHAIS